MTWSDWLIITKSINYSGPADYEVRIVSSDSIPFPINRFMDIDQGGILSIGETKNMEQRRNQFITGLTKCYGHSEFNLLHYLLKYSRINLEFPNHLIQFRYYPRKTKFDAQNAEKIAIKNYVRKHGEVPPLNSAIPDRYNGWEPK